MSYQTLTKPQPRFIWIGLLTICVVLEVAALYYQYILDYGPCILCVQIRALIGLIALIAILALLLPFQVSKVLSLLLMPLTLSFGWLCYQLLGIERGWFEGSCTFEPPFPTWIPLHEWLPSVFEAWELCGYTPDILFRITMAEVLIAIAALFIIANIILVKTLLYK